MIPPGVAVPLTVARAAPTAVEPSAPVVGSRRTADVGAPVALDDLDAECRSNLATTEAAGFVETLMATDDGYVECQCCGQRCDADDLLVLQVHEPTGAGHECGSPWIVAGVVCPTCTSAGTLVLGAGRNAPAGHPEVFRSMLAGRDPLAAS